MSSGLPVTRKTIYFDRTPTNYLLVNLAVADIIVALFITPQFILIHSFKHPGGLIGTVLCKLLTGGTFMWLGATTSAFTMVVIAFERYYAVILLLLWSFLVHSSHYLDVFSAPERTHIFQQMLQ